MRNRSKRPRQETALFAIKEAGRAVFAAQKRKGALAVLTGVLSMVLLGGAVFATDYYDGANASHLTPGAPSNMRSLTCSSNTEELVGYYQIQSIVERKSSSPTTYLTDKSEWRVRLADNSWVSYSSYTGSLSRTLPDGYSTGDAKINIKANGVAYYTCGTCGNTGAYIINFTEYGYYDNDGYPHITGSDGYMYCPQCCDNVATDWNSHPMSMGTKSGNGPSYRKINTPGSAYMGMYIYPYLTNYYDKFVWCTDIGVVNNTTKKTFFELQDQIKANLNQYVDSSHNGIYTSWVRSGTTNYGVKIANPSHNNTTVPFGYHFYNAYHEYVNIGLWEHSHNGQCIHCGKDDDNFCPLYYGSQNLGEEGKGFKNPYGKCLENYANGWLGYCADCDKRCVNVLVYSTPETISSVRKIQNGSHYFYVCPHQIGNMNLGSATIPYVYGQVENENPILHACKTVGINQYYLKFESNYPSEEFFNNSSYMVGGYFYNTFVEGADVFYVPEGTEIPFAPNVAGDIKGKITATKAKNTIESPRWDSNGYMFKSWEVYNGSSWLDIGATPTWQTVVDKIGATNSLLANDNGVVRIRATWGTPSATLKVVDGDTIGSGMASASLVSGIGPYTVNYMRTKTLGTPGNKNGTISYVAGNGAANPSNTETTAKFSNYSNYSGNKGIYDDATKTYMNYESTNGRVDYIIANYSWATISLPSVKKDSAVFMGWYTQPDGKGSFCGNAGAPYTPRGNSETLYGYWANDNMTIGAEVTDHTNGTSNVVWKYNNSDKVGTIFYKIYRNEGAYNESTRVCLTNGTSVGSTVSTSTITKSATSNDSYTIPTEGVYEIVLKGAAGGSVTGAAGGKGGTYTLTLLLKKDDILTYDFTTYSGVAAKKKQTFDGSFGNGGNAAALYLTRGGTKRLIAVASGGGGGMKLEYGEAAPGGDARAPQAAQTETALLSGNVLTQTTRGSGGGGGYTNGIYGTYHYHTGSGTRGSKSGIGTTYTSNSGCYTKEHDSSITCTITKIAAGYLAQNFTVSYSHSCSSSAHTGDQYWCQVSHSACGAGTSGSWNGGEWNGPWFSVCSSCEGFWSGDESEYNAWKSSNNKSTHVVPGDCVYSLKTGHSATKTASTGGVAYYNSDYIMSANFNANNTGGCSFSLTSKLLGITTKTSLTDTDTDDKAAPNAPVIGEIIGRKKTNASAKTSDIYLSNITWGEAADNGTTYTFSGETWDMMTTSYVKRCSTEKNAVVVVTSGVKEYEYEVYIGSTKVASGCGTTSDLNVSDVLCKAGQSETVVYHHTLTLKVRTKDKAGNYSDWVSKSVPVDGGQPVATHDPGVIDKPETTVNTGTGIYKVLGTSTYYVKADGMTKVKLDGKATLSITNKSRITDVNWNHTYVVNTPLLSHTSAASTIGGSLGSFVVSGNGSITALTDNKTTYSQYFVTTKEDTLVVTIHAKAECLGAANKGCADPGHVMDVAGDPVTIIGDKTSPTINVNGREFNDTDNFTSFDWGGNFAFTIKATDGGSGVKKVALLDNGNKEKASKSTTTRSTLETISYTETSDGIFTFTVEAEDNVGNKSSVKVEVKVDNTKPTIEDKTPGVTTGSVIPKQPPVGTPLAASDLKWPSTNKDLTWEYDWVNYGRTLTYQAYDDVSGVDYIRLYSATVSGSTWTRGGMLTEKKGNGEATAGIEYTIPKEGQTYYIVEAKDVKGNVTKVYIIARVDKSSPSNVTVTHNVIDMESFTIDQANAVVGGSFGLIETTWECKWKDINLTSNKTSQNDSSGLKCATLYLYDYNDPTIAKDYPITNVTFGGRTVQNTSSFIPVDRYLDASFTITVNTFTEFPDSSAIGWRIVAEDNVGNTFSKEGGDDVIKNYMIKAVDWATKNGAYNLLSDDGVTNTPYFKTGELGFVEVWTVGYVDKLELDFADGGIGQEAYSEILRGSLSPKYALGVHGGAPDDDRFVTTVNDHGTSSGAAANASGVPFASHYVYADNDVELSISTENTAGWISDGTMMRIPPSHELVKSGEKDKWGNDICKWEYRVTKVYGYKNGTTGAPATAPYVIWDETGDDVHYRLTHGTLGNY